MRELDAQVVGCAGRITLARPAALNAITHSMCLAIENALDEWRHASDIQLIIIDAEGDKAFCAGGDISALYQSAIIGDDAYGRSFWSDEYRLVSKLAAFPKPIISLMHGHTMGGGVGLSGHVSHRVVCESTNISMPECNIGLVPDVGGSLLLAHAPGKLGEYLALTAKRMGPGDAIFSGFADYFVPQESWRTLISELCESGDVEKIRQKYARPAPTTLAERLDNIETFFGKGSLKDIGARLRSAESECANEAYKRLSRNSPLSMALTLAILRRLRSENAELRDALELEYRVAHRIMRHGDFIEGIRATIIDKDQKPNWQHCLENVPSTIVTHLLKPLGADTLLI